MSTYAIGDVQGCDRALARLIERIAFDPARDELVFVGDLVNRGPHSLEVLRRVRALGSSARTVLGNHDLHLLMVAEGHGKKRHDDTLDAILAAPDRDELLDWLRRQPMMLRAGEAAVVHAGLLPTWTIQRAFGLAGEVEAVLRGPGYREFLAHMYGSRPDAWDESLSGWDRLRVIVNAMTRMRFCSASGVMEFATKGETSTAPPGYMPWFEVPGRAAADSTIVCGHWSALGVHLTERVVGIDSGCIWGGPLTALRLDDRSVSQVPCDPA